MDHFLAPASAGMSLAQGPAMWNRESEQTKESQIVHPAGSAPPGEERRRVTWLGKSVIFKGTFVSSEDTTIDGRVEGAIEAPNHGLTLGPDADIHADIVAKTVTIHGAVTGNIRASAKVDIRATGRIEGDLVTPRIVIADGAVVCGRVETLTQQADATKRRAQLAIV
jgi:cytoskeletal protein CcmA (bactofilin family)